MSRRETELALDAAEKRRLIAEGEWARTDATAADFSRWHEASRVVRAYRNALDPALSRCAVARYLQASETRRAQVARLASLP